jgi:hypothetical protein
MEENNSKHNHPTQIKAADEKIKGVYSNVTQVLHTQEEFVIDFLNIFPPTGILNARVIVSPGHFKRMVKAMQENLEKYEKSFGKIKESEKSAGEIGFKV